jgi:predicted pyridoxine 5'-phosphate oxidase superfamily flavin-nucleotide-binding protein
MGAARDEGGHDQEIFHDGEIRAQKTWGDPAVWDKARVAQLLWRAVPEEMHARIEAAPFFFLATSDKDGRCDSSFKGGGPGIIRMLAPNRLAFADFDGNGAFMSLGNILENPNVGLLFIDFNDGARLRINGRATIHDEGEIADLFPNAPRVVVVDMELVVPNCAQHIPRLIPA